MAAFIITGGQDNVQDVAGHLMGFFGEIGCQYPQVPYIAHSCGWTAEDMEKNVDVVMHSSCWITGMRRTPWSEAGARRIASSWRSWARMRGPAPWRRCRRCEAPDRSPLRTPIFGTPSRHCRETFAPAAPVSLHPAPRVIRAAPHQSTRGCATVRPLRGTRSARRATARDAR